MGWNRHFYSRMVGMSWRENCAPKSKPRSQLPNAKRLYGLTAKTIHKPQALNALRLNRSMIWDFERAALTCRRQWETTMARFSKKHYTAIAIILANVDRKGRSAVGVYAIQTIATDLAELFAADNQAFDAKRFIATAMEQNVSLQPRP